MEYIRATKDLGCPCDCLPMAKFPWTWEVGNWPNRQAAASSSLKTLCLMPSTGLPESSRYSHHHPPPIEEFGANMDTEGRCTVPVSKTTHLCVRFEIEQTIHLCKLLLEIWKWTLSYKTWKYNCFLLGPTDSHSLFKIGHLTPQSIWSNAWQLICCSCCLNPAQNDNDVITQKNWKPCQLKTKHFQRVGLFVATGFCSASQFGWFHVT